MATPRWAAEDIGMGAPDSIGIVKALHEDRAPTIPGVALCIHTQRGQEMGRTMYDWFATGTEIHPEVADRDVGPRDRLLELYHELDPPAAD